MKKTTFWLLVFFIFFAALAVFGLFLSPPSQKDGFGGRQTAAAPSISPSGSATIQKIWSRLSSPLADWVGLDQTPAQPPVGCPPGFQKCGGWCCNKKTQDCKTLGGSPVCNPKPKKCPPAIPQFCSGKDLNRCCRSEDSCGIITIPVDFWPDYQLAICVPSPPPGGCTPQSPGYCATIDGGTNVCCGSNQKCVKFVNSGVIVPYCSPTSCPPPPAGQTLCTGKMGNPPQNVAICCIGTCFQDPNGAPNCKPP